MPLTNDMLRLRTSQMADQSARPARTVVRERSHADELVTPEIALTVSAVIAAFTILSEDISSLPLILYERRGRNRFRAYDNAYYRLMHDQPNPEHTSMIFRELMMGHLLAWGNFFAQKIIDKRGDVVELWPLRPDRMLVKRFEGERMFIYRTVEGTERVFLSEEILHIPAFGFDGLVGYSRIALARNAIGLAIATEKYGSKFFGNGANPGIIIQHPGALGDNAYEHLKESWDARGGADNAHKPVILEEGMSIDRIGIPPDDAQYLETRKFQVSEIARIFRVPPHMIGDVERSTSWGSGIDSQEQGYVAHTLRPWTRRVDGVLGSQLLLPEEKTNRFFEHLFEELLRGDIATRYGAYVQAITNGWMTRNEVRERENMNPRKGLDVMLQPLNMTTVDEGTNGSPEGGETTSPAAALEPLWRDAIARVLKREENDVLGASKRWQAKGQQDKYLEWLDQFYSVDHPAFIVKQFVPIIEAQQRLVGPGSGQHVAEFMGGYLSGRHAQVKTLTAEQLSEGMADYLVHAADVIFSFVTGDLAIASTDTWEDEEPHE